MIGLCVHAKPFHKDGSEVPVKLSFNPVETPMQLCVTRLILWNGHGHATRP